MVDEDESPMRSIILNVYIKIIDKCIKIIGKCILKVFSTTIFFI